ncbi:MAG: decarboxylating 6-phosphogluconate dehydrogenase [Hyphomicrobiaceae bacterium]|nr:MAG: decarboxylating 6-phosphogluconate dehydrogenase [Hyphomicrobiaceae bacterium]
MQIGMAGLGRMGANIARRLARAGHSVTGFDTDTKARDALGAEGIATAASLVELVGRLAAPRAVWLMLPSGPVTAAAIDELSGLLSSGDTIIDGGNSYWKDAIRRSKALARSGIDFLDIGTSGGVWGLERGYCLMIGGKAETVARLDPILAALAPGKGSIADTTGRAGRDPRPEQGYLHAGGNGAGHFVKMIHNGIEYGMMQAMAEGFEIMRQAGSMERPEEERLSLDLADVAETWRRGSVISSWLLDLTAAALAADPALDGYSGHVSDSGEGRWTVEAAVQSAVPAPVLSAALYTRFRSRQEKAFAEQLLSAMREGFGGHREPNKRES